jgi:hypothetical protein
VADFVLNADVVTDQPKVEVTASEVNPLPLGTHLFRLFVIDDMGNASLPAEVSIVVADLDNPTALITAPRFVTPGITFSLDGSGSFDMGGGKVVQWTWTYLGQSAPVVPTT